MSFITIIPAGHVGVIDVFGNVSDKTLDPGPHFVNPVANIVKLSVKTQEIKEENMGVPSREGLSVDVDISGLFHLNPRSAGEVYKSVGENYVDVIFRPQFRSVVRGVTSAFEAKALYTSDRETIASLISQELSTLIEKRGIIVESTPLRKVMLPAKLRESVEEKLQAEQRSQAMEFVLTKEKQEAERKRIEAKGIADFQKIVTEGISEPLLKWKGIEATEKLAESHNTKVVIIGAGKDGLPIILNGDGSDSEKK